MQRVSSLVSKDVGNYLTNVQTWRGVIYNVKSYGAEGDGVTDDKAAIQSAIDAAYDAGGGQVRFPAGTYMCYDLACKDNVFLVGTFGSVTLKVPDGLDKQILSNPNQATGDSIDFFGMEGIIFDGNKANALGVTASSAVAPNICTYFYAKDCVFKNATGYGLAYQAYPDGPIDGNQEKIYLENCYFIDNGDGVGGDTFDGLDIKYCADITLFGCYAIGNSDRGINIRGIKVNVSDCVAENNGSDGFLMQGNHNSPTSRPTEINMNNCFAYSNGQSGVFISDGSSTATEYIRVNITNTVSKDNTLYGINLDAGSNHIYGNIQASHVFENTDHGIYAKNTMAGVIISNSIVRSNGGSGIYTNGDGLQISDCRIISNARYGIEEGTPNGTRTIIGGSTFVNGNTLGNFLFNTNKRYMVSRGMIDYTIGSSTNGDIIASATTITLPEGGEVFYITGTTTITTITASRRSRIVVLHFTGALTVQHATGNIRLASGANKSTANRHQLTLVCEGTSWFEMAYSANA